MMHCLFRGTGFTFGSLFWKGLDYSIFPEESGKMFSWSFSSLQLLSKIFIDSDFCHNYLHTLYLFECL